MPPTVSLIKADSDRVRCRSRHHSIQVVQFVTPTVQPPLSTQNVGAAAFLACGAAASTSPPGSIKFVGFVYFHRWQRRRRMNVRPKGQIANVDKSVPPSRPFLENASCGAWGKCLCDVFETRPIIFFASISFSTMGKAKFILPTETHIVCLSVCFSCFSIFPVSPDRIFFGRLRSTVYDSPHFTEESLAVHLCRGAVFPPECSTRGLSRGVCGSSGHDMEIRNVLDHVSLSINFKSLEQKYVARMMRDSMGWFLVPSFLRFGSSTSAPQTGSQISSLYTSRVASSTRNMCPEQPS